jgi:hypothetical protein
MATTATSAMPETLKACDAHVRLELTPAGWKSRVFIGDKELRGVRSIKVNASVSEVTTVHLELYALGGMTIEGVAGLLSAAVTTEAQIKASTPKEETADVTAIGDANRVYRRGEVESE